MPTSLCGDDETHQSSINLTPCRIANWPRTRLAHELHRDRGVGEGAAVAGGELGDEHLKGLSLAPLQEAALWY